MSSPFPGLGPEFDIGGLFGQAKLNKDKAVEKGIPWNAKVIDGAYYVPLSQVVELLTQNGVLPKVAEGIKRRVEKGPPGPVRTAGSEKMNDQ